MGFFAKILNSMIMNAFEQLFNMAFLSALTLLDKRKVIQPVQDCST